MTEAAAPKARIASQDDFLRVLEAEKAADARLLDGRAEAGRIHQRATATERRLGERTDRRLRALHAAMKACIETEKARRAAAFEAERGELSAPHSRAEIAAAADRLARRLAGIAEP